MVEAKFHTIHINVMRSGVTEVNLNSLKKSLIGPIALLSTSVWSADLTNGIDPLSPGYIKSTELLSQVDQILAQALVRAEHSFALQDYPSLDEARFIELIQLLRSDLKVVLEPERRRMEYQVVTPDGAFVITDDQN